MNFFLNILAVNGYPQATITNYNNDVFTCDSKCEDYLYDEKWRYYWFINISKNSKIKEMTWSDSYLYYLMTWGDKQIMHNWKIMSVTH